MPTPTVYSYPVKRPAGWIHNANWQGDDSDLELHFSYTKPDGNDTTFSLRATDQGAGQRQEICIPNNGAGYTLDRMERDLLVAHVRMATLIGQTIPGSTEWMAAFLEGASKNLQTPVGVVTVEAIELLDHDCVRMTFQRTQSDTVQHDIGYGELRNYSWAPTTQLLCVAGAIEKEYPNHHHSPQQPLSASERADIAAYVNGLECWM